MTKAEIRFFYRQKRADIPDVERRAKEEALQINVLADPRIRAALTAPGAVLHTFLPIRRQHEIDTWPIIRQIWAEFPHIRVLAAITSVQPKKLTSFDLRPYTALAENKWGIPEPINPPEPVLALPTLVLVPLLAFDRLGNRVGYGGGYYDRFLAEIGPNCLRIGLSLAEPVHQIDDIEPTDVALHGFVCPTKVYWI